MRSVLWLIVASAIIAITPSITFAAGLAVKEAIITPKNGDVMVVQGGYYFTDQEGKLVAQGIQDVNAELERLKMERDAYKEAYESQVDMTSQYAKLLKDAWYTYDRRVKATEELIQLYEEKDKVRQAQIIDAKADVRKHQFLNILLSIGLVVVLL